MSRSLELKEEGNRHFQDGDYVGAESLYSKAYAHRFLIKVSVLLTARQHHR